ncbi:hypothetical protein OG696_40650 [Streptomyces sp. NBC_00656]
MLLRHHEVTTRTGLAEQTATLGVLLTPRRGGNSPWDTTSIRVEGHLDLPDDELQLYRQAWNRTPEDGTAVPGWPARPAVPVSPGHHTEGARCAGSRAARQVTVGLRRSRRTTSRQWR